MEWIKIEENGKFPEDNQEVLCWNGERVLMGIYRCTDDEKFGGYEFEVQKYPSQGERIFKSYWTGITHWALPETPSGGKI